MRMTAADPTPGNTEKKARKPTLLQVLVPVAAILVLASTSLWLIKTKTSQAPASQPTGPADLRVGAILPKFELREIKSSSDLPISSIQGKVRLINFWATWCEACMEEMPSIIKLHQAYRDKGFEVVAVDLDNDPPAVVPRAARKYGMSFPIYMDVDSRLADLFNIQAIPLSVVIDANRKILMIENEGVDWDGPEFRKTLEAWLAG